MLRGDNQYKVLIKMATGKGEIVYVMRVFPKGGTFTLPDDLSILDAWMVK